MNNRNGGIHGSMEKTGTREITNERNIAAPTVDKIEHRHLVPGCCKVVSSSIVVRPTMGSRLTRGTYRATLFRREGSHHI